jgi:uncharacterized protein involved in exopolysaccharide biosynthesis
VGNRLFRVLAVAVALAWAVTLASLVQTPTYEASAVLLVDGQQEDDRWTSSGGSSEGIQTLEWVELPTQRMIHTIDGRPVAEETIRHYYYWGGDRA